MQCEVWLITRVYCLTFLLGLSESKEGGGGRAACTDIEKSKGGVTVEKCDQFTNRQLHAWESMHGN